MRRRYAILFAASLLLAGWGAVRFFAPPVEARPIPQASSFTPRARSEALAVQRRSCRAADLESFIHEQRRLVAADTDSAAQHRRVLAEALLERISEAVMHRGLRPGAVLFTELPDAIARDVDEGLALLLRARELGDECSESHRIEASLLSYRILDLGSALQYYRRVVHALDRALELDPDNPRAHVVLGCRQLFAPRFLGRDLADAERHFRFAIDAMPLDARPLMFASLAALHRGERDRARELIERAARRNPANWFVVEVARRFAAGEDEPFARDVERPGAPVRSH